MSDPITRLNAALEGRYRIERELGEGGMATVYLADDIKHERKVALKVLKPELAAVVGAERFLAEIKTTANLQHPHILPLHDSGEADGFLFYVMPYVEGESLRDRLDREHQLPVDDALRIATNMAEALDYAHRRGVIHRDIKPANVLLQEGTPVISDFGIALAVSAGGGARLTETGLSLGTPHYMSPEQATGDEHVGTATDIYALGCVLYEMLVGEPPYTGSTAQAVLGKIIAGELASATKQRASVPANVDAAIRKALEKLPADRFTGAQDFARALAEPLFRHGEVAGAAVPTTGTRWRRVSMALAGTITVLLFALVWFATRPQPRVDPVSFVLTPPNGLIISARSELPLVITPDGTRFAFLASRREAIVTALYVRDLGSTELGRVSGVNRYPFFSPDGMWVGSFSRATGQLQKRSVEGSPPLAIAEDVRESLGASWGRDNTIIVATGGGLMRVSSEGGELQPLTTPDPLRGETDHRWPHVLPGGAVLFTSWSGGPETARLAAVSPETGEVVHFNELGLRPQYADPGYVLLVRVDGSVVAIPFDAERLRVQGPSIPLLAEVAISPSGAPQIAVSESGSIVYARASSEAGRTLVMVDREGDESPVNARTGGYNSPRFSPTGDHLSVTIDRELWLFDVEQEILSVRSTGGGVVHPTWSPDGARISYSLRGTGLFSVPADGSAGEEPFFADGQEVWEHQVSPDGAWIAYRIDTRPAVVRNIFVASLTAPEEQPRPYAQSPADERMLAISPDGGWLAYISDESGRNEVYIRSFPDPGRQIPVSRDGGTAPRWSRDGRELFYRSGDEMMAAAVETEPTLEITGREALFEDYEYRRSSIYAAYDVDPVSGRFIMIRERTLDLVVIQHFVEALDLVSN